MPDVAPFVFIVDDDVSVRESVRALVAAANCQAMDFSCAQDFLDYPRKPLPSCLILDVGLPDLDGLELQRRMISDGTDIPIIIITGRGDIPMTVQAMRAGAIEFLTKPLNAESLMSAIELALERSRSRLVEQADLQLLTQRYQSLSRREREVMHLVVRGLLNKQVAGEIGISEITVKAHRGKVMRKMQVRSLADLVRAATRLGLAAETTG